MKRIVLVATAFTILCSASVLASMPPLTEKPSLVTKETCARWSAEQSEDALEMWGVKDDGASSREIAKTRLTKHCLGEKAPEIVGFGSSAGFDKVYCNKFSTARICNSTRATSLGPSSERFNCWGTYSSVQTGAADASGLELVLLSPDLIYTIVVEGDVVGTRAKDVQISAKQITFTYWNSKFQGECTDKGIAHRSPDKGRPTLLQPRSFVTSRKVLPKWEE